jgi:hypothetical protein
MWLGLRKSNLYTVSVVKSFDKGPLGRLRQKDNIKIWLIVIGFKDVKWMKLAQDHFQLLVLVLAVLTLRILRSES